MVGMECLVERTCMIYIVLFYIYMFQQSLKG